MRISFESGKPACHIILLLILQCVSLTVFGLSRQQALGDDEIRSLMLGSWVISPSDEDFLHYGGKSTYHADGSLTYHDYTDASCNTLAGKVTGRWRLENGLLIINVTRSGIPDAVPVGTVTIDHVQHINERSKILVSVEGHVQHRRRSETCILAPVPPVP